MTIEVSQHLSPIDTVQARRIVLGIPDGVDGILDYPESRSSWPDLKTRDIDACGPRYNCTGCDHIARFCASGVVAVLKDSTGVTHSALCGAERGVYMPIVFIGT